MTADKEKINQRNRERYRSSAKIRQKRSEVSHKYYLSHKQKWRMYAKTRRRKVYNQVQKQCGGLQL